MSTSPVVFLSALTWSKLILTEIEYARYLMIQEVVFFFAHHVDSYSFLRRISDRDVPYKKKFY